MPGTKLPAETARSVAQTTPNSPQPDARVSGKAVGNYLKSSFVPCLVHLCDSEITYNCIKALRENSC